MKIDLHQLGQIHLKQAKTFLDRHIGSYDKELGPIIHDMSDRRSFDQNKISIFLILAEQVENEIKKIEKRTAYFPTCSQGCSSCCYQAIYVASEEIKIITAWIKQQKDSAFIRLIKERIQSWHSSFRKTGFSYNTNDSSDYKAKYFRAHIPCPFLNESNSCMIYPVRPGACRTYFSFGDKRACSSSAFVENTFDVVPWSTALLISYILAHESVINNPDLFDTHIDTSSTLLPIRVNQLL